MRLDVSVCCFAVCALLDSHVTCGCCVALKITQSAHVRACACGSRIKMLRMHSRPVWVALGDNRHVTGGKRQRREERGTVYPVVMLGADLGLWHIDAH